MMSELREVQATVQPSDTLLVVDAMTGQEAAGLVKAFNEAAEITGARAINLLFTFMICCEGFSTLGHVIKAFWTLLN